MKIAIASGKGGTGKTTLSIALATYLSKQKQRINLLDCDVEEPNVNLFIKADIRKTEDVYSFIPVIDETKCNFCGQCEKICAFSSIVVLENKVLLYPEMCHDCKGCSLVCSQGAIDFKKKKIGLIEVGDKDNIHYYGGTLKVGETMSPPLINAVKEKINNDYITILDSPPGTSCPVLASVDGVDFVVLVTEPTPFGLNDLKLSVKMIRKLGIPFGVIINRHTNKDNPVENYCKNEKIKILTMIADSRTVAEKYAKGKVIEYFINTYEKELSEALDFILKGISA